MRKKKVKEEVSEGMNMDKLLEQPAKLSIEEMPLITLGDYVRYNEEARRLNKKLKLCRYPIKVPPTELHPTERVQFQRNDQPNNPLSVYKSDDMIDFKMKLVPGNVYDLPRYIVDYLMEKGYPVWKWFTNPDGSKETRISHKVPRFSLRTIYRD